MNALLDYGSSSSSDTEDETEDKPGCTEDQKPKLPKPTLGESSLQTSVFSNPFAEEEMAKAAILEKHVKMNIYQLVYPFLHTIVKYIGNDCKVPGKNNMVVINGKKICWNHRKGRCRFGHNCKYAHDTDLQKSSEELEGKKQNYKAVVYEGSATMQPSEVLSEPIAPTDDALWEGGSGKRKMKRPGLSQGITPSKKVLKIYNEQKLKESNKKT